MINADFENISFPEDNRKKNLDESYTSKYQKHVAYSYCYKLSRPFRSYLLKILILFQRKV